MRVRLGFAPVSVLSAMHVGVLFAARGVLLFSACTWLFASGCFVGMFVNGKCVKRFGSFDAWLSVSSA